MPPTALTEEPTTPWHEQATALNASPIDAREFPPVRDDRSVVREIFHLALPVLGQNLLEMAVGWSDTLLTGRIFVEAKYLAGVTVASYLLFLMHAFSSVVTTGVQAVVARLVGGRNRAEANEIVLQALLLAGGTGLLLGTGMWVGAPVLARLMNLSMDSQTLCISYLRIVALSAPAMVVLLAGIAALRAAGQTLAGMWIMGLVNVVNIAVSWGLATGLGPLPAWGWNGIAMGTAVGFGVGGCVTIAWLWVGCGRLQLPQRFPWLELGRCARVLRIGIPGAADSVGLVIGHLWFLSIIGALGNVALAAHGVALRCESLSWLTAEAFSVATAALVGQSLGAGQPHRAQRIGWTAYGLGAVCLSGLGVVFFVGAPFLVRLFVDPAEQYVIEQAVPVLRLVAFSMPALASCIILNGALRGAGDTRLQVLYNALGLLLIRIPLAYALTGGMVAWGLLGAWSAMLIDLYTRGGAAATRFWQGGWTKLRV